MTHAEFKRTLGDGWRITDHYHAERDGVRLSFIGPEEGWDAHCAGGPRVTAGTAPAALRGLLEHLARRAAGYSDLTHCTALALLELPE